jgi:hypothetical protein
VLSVPYQRGDFGVPKALSNLHRISAILILEVDVAARSNELRCDGRMPITGRVVESRSPTVLLKIDVTSSSNQLFRDGLMPFLGREVERCGSNISLKMDVTASCNEQLRHSRMPCLGSPVERRAPIIVLKIDVTALCNELFRDGLMTSTGSTVERRETKRVLVVDEGLRVLCRQQRANLRCVTTTRGIPKLLPRHGFPAPSLCFLSLFPCNLHRPSVRPTH